jgi:hypothetical protein
VLGLLQLGENATSKAVFDWDLSEVRPADGPSRENMLGLPGSAEREESALESGTY